ncbi:MAG: glycosyltransferase [Parvularculaceae bacterium]
MDAGGKIRTANLLKNMKGGAFRLLLALPAETGALARHEGVIAALADEIFPLPVMDVSKFAQAICVAGPTPVSALAMARAASRRAVAATIAAASPDIVVFDYAQSYASAPRDLDLPSVIFAHNVEAEILRRHALHAGGAKEFIWRREAKKMARFERAAAQRTDGVIAVSQRDAVAFAAMGAARAYAIPTGVDTDYFSYAPPPDDAAPVVVFTGSMDWRANVDGLYWFLNEVWPQIAAAHPTAQFIGVGKNPPAKLVRDARARGVNWRFTGYVDDIREHARGAVFVIPLRIGGGARIKAFEAMALGVPVVSTAIGVEGLCVDPGVHYQCADDAGEFARAVICLLENGERRRALSVAARVLVETQFSHAVAAREFESHCLAVIGATHPSKFRAPERAEFCSRFKI